MVNCSLSYTAFECPTQGHDWVLRFESGVGMGSRSWGVGCDLRNSIICIDAVMANRLDGDSVRLDALTIRTDCAR